MFLCIMHKNDQLQACKNIEGQWRIELRSILARGMFDAAHLMEQLSSRTSLSSRKTRFNQKVSKVTTLSKLISNSVSMQFSQLN